MLLKLILVQPSLRTAGPCPEPEWADPDRVWLAPSLKLLGMLNSYFALLSALSNQEDFFFCPIILLSITYCLSSLLISFKYQEYCQSLYFQFEIWTYRDATK